MNIDQYLQCTCEQYSIFTMYLPFLIPAYKSRQILYNYHQNELMNMDELMNTMYLDVKMYFFGHFFLNPDYLRAITFLIPAYKLMKVPGEKPPKH